MPSRERKGVVAPINVKATSPLPRQTWQTFPVAPVNMRDTLPVALANSRDAIQLPRQTWKTLPCRHDRHKRHSPPPTPALCLCKHDRHPVAPEKVNVGPLSRCITRVNINIAFTLIYGFDAHTACEGLSSGFSPSSEKQPKFQSKQWSRPIYNTFHEKTAACS